MIVIFYIKKYIKNINYLIFYVKKKYMTRDELQVEIANAFQILYF
jgi:hypothetical protein